MKDNKSLGFCLFTPRNICCEFLLKSPRGGASNKYSERMFLGVLDK